MQKMHKNLFIKLRAIVRNRMVLSLSIFKFYCIDNINLCKKSFLFSTEQTTIRYNFTARFAIPIPKQASHRRHRPFADYSPSSNTRMITFTVVGSRAIFSKVQPAVSFGACYGFPINRINSNDTPAPPTPPLNTLAPHRSKQ